MIKNKESRFKQFVEERARKIRSFSEVSEGMHVSGEDNPADLTTRPMMPGELKNNEFWLHGPQWLKLPVSEWPVADDVARFTEESVSEMRVEDKKVVV